MRWTPALDPPHPSTVTDLSPCAQRILAYLRRESQQPLHPTLDINHVYAVDNIPTLATSVAPCLFTNLVIRSKYFSTDVSPENQQSSQTSIARVLQDFNHVANPKIPLNHDYMVQNTNMQTRTSICSDNFHIQLQENNTRLPNIKEGISSVIHNQIKTFDNSTNFSSVEDFQSDLSPYTDLENLEVYSFLQEQRVKEKEQREPDRKLQFMPSQNVDPSVLQFGLKENYGLENKTFKQNTFFINSLQPSDQRFIFTSKTPAPAFKKKLANSKKTEKPHSVNTNWNRNTVKSNVRQCDLQTKNETKTTSSTKNVFFDGHKPVETVECNTRGDSIIKNDTFPRKGSKQITDFSIENGENMLYNQCFLETNKRNNSNTSPTIQEEEIHTISDTLEKPDKENSQLYESLFINTQNSEDRSKQLIEPQAKDTEQNFVSLSNIEVCAVESSDDEFDVEDLFSLKKEVVMKVLGKTKSHSSTPNVSKPVGVSEVSIDSKSSLINLLGTVKSGFNLENKCERFKQNNQYTSTIPQSFERVDDLQKDFTHKEMYHNKISDTYLKQSSEDYTFDQNYAKSVSLDDANIRSSPISIKENNHDRFNRLNEVSLTGNQKDEFKIQRNIIRRKFSADNKSLRQSTIKQFLPPVLKEKEGSKEVVSQLRRNKIDLDNCFKKPNPPKYQSSNSKKPNLSAIKAENKTQLQYLARELKTKPKKPGKLVDTGKKLVQTTLTKPEFGKRSLATSTQSAKKMQCFTAPVLSSHDTSQSVTLKDYKISELNDISCDEIVDRVSIAGLQKVVVTVCFREGYTLLNKPGNLLKNTHCVPSGLMFMVQWQSGATDYYYLHLAEYQGDSTVKSVVHSFLTQSERVVCFEAQAFFMLIIDIFQFEDTSQWHALDPLVACWLLDPDNPPKDFTEVVVKLELDRSLLVVNPKADKKTQACDLLPVLDLVIEILQKRLCNSSLWMLFSEFEMNLTPLLALMECSSIVVDIQRLHKNTGALEKKLKVLQKEAHCLAGHMFQLNSYQQLRQVLYDELKLDVEHKVEIKQTEQGAKSTSETALCQLKPFHKLPNIVLQYRHLQKIKSTYVDGLLQFVKKKGDVCTISTIWEQVGTATGRITSKNPNLQAIPKVVVSLDEGEEIHLRDVFKAREDHSFLAADFQQIEFRVFAHYTQDVFLLQMFEQGGDIFTELSRRWLGGESAVDREKTKRIVYAVMYGAGPQKLAEYLQVSVEEANSIIDNFVDNFPSLRSLPKSVIAQCRTQGYIVTLSGRRRLFPHICSTNYKLRSYSERQAINFLIQGSAADICKAAMLDSDRELKARNFEAKLLLQIHDELVWEVKDQHLQEAARVVRQAMEHSWGDRWTLKVSVPVSVCSGKTLADMKPLDAHSK